MKRICSPTYKMLKQCICSRRSIRYYSDRPVDLNLLYECLDNSRFSPSAHNRQPWRFCVINDKANKVKSAQVMGKRLEADRVADGDSMDDIQIDLKRSYQRITQSFTIIMVFLTMEDMDNYTDHLRNQHEYTMAVQSTAMAVQNILLSLSALGLGACWMCAPLFCPDAIRESFSIPLTWQPQSLITVGYPVDLVKLRTRKKINDITILI